MTLKNTNTKDRGFTIVELLIVIVVIAILATIMIVAYSGMQNRAKASAGQSLASQVLKKAEAWNTVLSAYPTAANLGTGNTAVPEAKLENSAAVTGAPLADAAAAKDGTVVTYQACATGARAGYWDFTKPAATALTWQYTGGATSGTTCTAT